MTKTQRELLTEAAASRHGNVFVTLVGGHGFEGGQVRGGARRSSAACKLRDAGLLVFVQHDHDKSTRNGWTTFYTTSTWTLTDAGRAAVAALASN